MSGRLAGIVLATITISGVLSAGVLAAGTASASTSNCPTVDAQSGAVTPSPAPGVDWQSCNLDGANLAGADLNGANLSYSVFEKATFTGADLADVDFTHSNLEEAVSGGVTGAPAAMPLGYKLIGGYLLGQEADLAGADLSGLNLTPLDLDEADLEGADLTGADFAGDGLAFANMTGTQLADADLNGADLTRAQSGAITGTPASLPANWQLAAGYLVGPEANLTGADLAGQSFSGADLDGAAFDNTDLAGTNLESANLDQTVVLDSDLSGTTMAGATLANAQSGGNTGTPSSLPGHWMLADGYLIGPDAGLANAQLSDADLAGADIAGAYLSGAQLSDANLDGASLAGSVMVSTDLAGSSLDRADLANAYLDNTDLKGATVTGASFADATWYAVTCPDGLDSDAYRSGCFSQLLTTTKAAYSAATTDYGHEQSQRITVTVSAASGIPAGTVTVKSGTATVCTATLTSGVGSCTVPATKFGPGPHPLTASYGGAAGFAISAAPARAFTVTRASSKTSLTLSASRITFGHEQSEHLTVKITPQYSGTPSGKVSVKSGSTTICTITLASGKGTCTLSSKKLRTGTYHPAAAFPVGTNFAGSTSARLTLTVLR
jgi:uncharacterized protein YjbI with pentapeptide repeats